MKASTREWVEKAEADFATAGREFRARRQLNYDAVCFHAQRRALWQRRPSPIARPSVRKFESVWVYPKPDPLRAALKTPILTVKIAPPNLFK